MALGQTAERGIVERRGMVIAMRMVVVEIGMDEGMGIGAARNTVLVAFELDRTGNRSVGMMIGMRKGVKLRKM